MSKNEPTTPISSTPHVTRSGIASRSRPTLLPAHDSCTDKTHSSGSLVSPLSTVESGEDRAGSAKNSESWCEWWKHSHSSSFLISLVFHSGLLALLAIPITRHLTQSAESTTLVEVIDPVIGGDGIGEFIDAPELMAEVARHGDGLDSPMVDFSGSDLSLDATSALSAAGAAGGSDDGTGTADIAGAVGGYLLRAPGNAVRAGRFTAFSRPILTSGVGDKKREAFGEPGEAPREGQAYFIVIHIKVDPRRKTYPIADLVGSVVGTDGYVQRVPDEMYVLNEEGQPVEIKRSKPVRVTEGVVQLLMRVKGAQSGVRDNIFLKSKMLREEQNLQLVFQARTMEMSP